MERQQGLDKPPPGTRAGISVAAAMPGDGWAETPRQLSGFAMQARAFPPIAGTLRTVSETVELVHNAAVVVLSPALDGRTDLPGPLSCICNPGMGVNHSFRFGDICTLAKHLLSVA
jgi:hypothetical protein